MMAAQMRQRSMSRGLSSDSFDISGMMQSSTTSAADIAKYKQEHASLQLQVHTGCHLIYCFLHEE